MTGFGHHGGVFFREVQAAPEILLGLIEPALAMEHPGDAVPELGLPTGVAEFFGLQEAVEGILHPSAPQLQLAELAENPGPFSFRRELQGPAVGLQAQLV